MSIKENKPKDPNEERITRLEASQDALAKQVAGMDAYFKAPEGLTKQIQDTIIATIPGIIQNEFQTYDKSVQERFATRSDVRQGSAPVATAQGSPPEHPFNIQGLIQTVVETVQKVAPTATRTADPNYIQYLAIRDSMMEKALGGIGRGIGLGVQREVAKHIVSFE